VGRKQRGCRTGLICGSVCSCAGAEKGTLGSLKEADVGVPRQGAGWRGVGFGTSSLLGGVEYATVCLLTGCTGQSGRAVNEGAEAGRWVAWGGISQYERGAGWRGMRSGEGGALGSREVAAAGLSRHGAGWRGVGLYVVWQQRRGQHRQMPERSFDCHVQWWMVAATNTYRSGMLHHQGWHFLGGGSVGLQVARWSSASSLILPGHTALLTGVVLSGVQMRGKKRAAPVGG
jgi:hypothetical protein